MRSPGQQARRGGAVLLVLGLVLGVWGLVARSAEADLRDLPSLRQVEAQVVDHERRSRAPALLEIAYEADGRSLTARTPYSGPARAGDRLVVAHLPGDPSRVRPVDGWSPGYQRLVGYALLLVPAGALLSGLGVLSRRRGSRFEGDRPLPTAPQDAGLGRRVVRGSPLVHALSVAPLAAVGLVTLGLSTLTSRPGPIALVGGLLLVVTAALSAFMWWNHGRDGVWSTPTHLVARRRSHLRRWPWEQVHELGFVVQKGQALVASARVDDGLDDGIGADEWVTLARPLLGPLSAHEFARRARALAEERGLPLAEDVHRLDLADTGLGRLARRGPGSWARR